MIQEAVSSRVELSLRVLTLEDMLFCLPALVDAISPYSVLDPQRPMETYTDAEELRELILRSFRSIPDDPKNYDAFEAFMTAAPLIETMARLRLKRNARVRWQEAA